MGIDFSHCNAHWSYSGFHAFRKRLAAEAGIDLEQMQGFVKETAAPGRSWDDITDPIKLLLNHSYCDGELSPEDCALIAPRLWELVSSWPDDFGSDTGYDKIHALRLAEGMELAAKQGKPLIFC